MKTKDLKELRARDVKSLGKLASEKRETIMKQSMGIVSGKEKNTKSVKINRRELAKILTLIREKEIIEKLEAESKTK